MVNPDPKDIEALVELFDQSDWDEMHLKTDDLEIFLSNDPRAVAPSQMAALSSNETVPVIGDTVSTVPATAAAPSASVFEVPDGMVAVSAPNLGTFYRAPKPGAPAYVEVGHHVAAESEVCLIEVMKLFTPVAAGTAGIVREICIEDGELVEFGQVLVVIEPQESGNDHQ